MRETIEHLSGAVYLERYAIDRVLPHTGMGTLFKATQLAVQRPVALRIVNPRKEGNLAELERFSAEARQIATLHHANIVGLIDFGQDEEGRLYLVREYLEGERLAAVVEREAPFAPERVHGIAVQLLDALAEAHKRGVLHRDLNPLNIFVDRLGYQQDFIKLLEFRIRSTGNEVYGAHPEEPPYYRSPEDIRGEALTAQSDIYSVGAVLYELLTGRRPFDGDGVEAVVRSILDDEPPPPMLKGRRIRGPLVDVILACLSKDPAARPAGACGVVAMLDARGDEDLVRVSETVTGMAPIDLPIRAEPERKGLDRGTLPYGPNAVPALSADLVVPSAAQAEPSAAAARAVDRSTGPLLSHEHVTIRHGGREAVRLEADCELPGARSGDAFEIPAPPRRNPWPLLVGVGGLAALVVAGALMLAPSRDPAAPAAGAGDAKPGAAAAAVASDDGPAPQAADASPRATATPDDDAGSQASAPSDAGASADPAAPADVPPGEDAGARAAADAASAGPDAETGAAAAGPRDAGAAPDASRGPAQVRIESTPSGARVERASDGLLLGTTPATVTWSGEAPLKVRVVAEGRVPQALELTDAKRGGTERLLLEPTAQDEADKADKKKKKKRKKRKRRDKDRKRPPSSVRDILND